MEAADSCRLDIAGMHSIGRLVLLMEVMGAFGWEGAESCRLDRGKWD